VVIKIRKLGIFILNARRSYVTVRLVVTGEAWTENTRGVIEVLPFPIRPHRCCVRFFFFIIIPKFAFNFCLRRFPLSSDISILWSDPQQLFIHDAWLCRIQCRGLVSYIIFLFFFIFHFSITDFFFMNMHASVSYLLPWLVALDELENCMFVSFLLWLNFLLMETGWGFQSILLSGMGNFL